MLINPKSRPYNIYPQRVSVSSSGKTTTNAAHGLRQTAVMKQLTDWLQAQASQQRLSGRSGLHDLQVLQLPSSLQ